MFLQCQCLIGELRVPLQSHFTLVLKLGSVSGCAPGRVAQQKLQGVVRPCPWVGGRASGPSWMWKEKKGFEISRSNRVDGTLRLCPCAARGGTAPRSHGTGGCGCRVRGAAPAPEPSVLVPLVWVCPAGLWSLSAPSSTNFVCSLSALMQSSSLTALFGYVEERYPCSVF